MSAEKPPKRKKVTVELLERKHAGKVTEAYRIMEELVEKHHSQIKDAKLAIAWRFGWGADPDGHLRLADCKKGSDLDRSMHGYDFVFLVNHEAWNQGRLDEQQKRLLIDHQLCHAAVCMDSNGEPKQDEKGRQVFRKRKHDVEEFTEVMSRYGTDINRLAKLAEAGINDSKRPLLAGQE